MPEAWRTAYPLEQRELDGEIVAYCDATGDTFKLAPVAHAVLEVLTPAPKDLQALSATAAKTFAADQTAIEPIVADTVYDLESLGIVERVSL